MKNFKLLKTCIYVILTVWVTFSVVGCTQANSISSLNPASAETNPESILNTGTAATKSSENFAPVVNLIADKTTVGTNAEVSLRAETLDPEGGQVEINWDADVGNLISTAGDRAVWKAPEIGTSATISCTASDSEGKTSRAEVKIEVLSDGTYRLMVLADRSAIQTGRLDLSASDLYIPVSGARVEIPELGITSVTGSDGTIEFNVNHSENVATGAYATVKYLDWEVGYYANLKTSSGIGLIQDSITFAPGYDGISIAVGRGDSFNLKRGAIEVTTIENQFGQVSPVAEVTVDAGSAQSISSRDSGMAIIASLASGNNEVNLRLSKTGYQTIDGYFIPVTLDGLTLVRARLEKAGTIPDSDAIISWTRPYNYQKSFPVTGPFEVGFGQPMEKETIFDDMTLMIQNKETGSVIAVAGNDIAKKFRVEWKGSSILRLYPKKPLRGLTRYSILISRWVARAVDGRMLKSYDGMYGEFTTDSDDAPKILSTYPVNGQKDVGRSGPFTINFDRSMLPESLFENLEIEITSLDSNSKLLVDGSNLKSHFSVTWKNANTVLELVPYRMLGAERSYLVRLNSCDLRSESGKKADGFANLWGQFTTGKL
ncbi:MAG: hypothetical protein Kow0029_14820 [Candidatus Rifleibacteriota bacterium]